MKRVRVIVVLLLVAALLATAGCTGQRQGNQVQDRDRDVYTALDEAFTSQADAALFAAQAGRLPRGLLNATEKQDIIDIREREKLARDVYLVFWQRWNLPVFYAIAESEQAHMDSVAVLIERHSLVDPSTGEQGSYANQTLEELYDRFVEEGRASPDAALQAGAFIEETSIAGLQTALNRTDEYDIGYVYENLQRGSRNHLRAFVRDLVRRGKTYSPQVLSDEDYEAIVGTSVERP